MSPAPDPAALAAVIREAAEDGPTGRALPAACYLDPDVQALERERVLRPAWHPIARCDELPEPGDYRSLELCGEPLLLVRGDDGELRCLSRVCLHRAFPFVTGEGRAQRFSCPYHRWVYDREGRLRSAPLMDRVEGFDTEPCRLPRLRLETWQGFVFATLDPDAAPLAPQLAPLGALFEGLDLAGYRSAGVLEFDSPWNWKIMVENFMESYHHMGPHAQTLQPQNPAKDTHVLDLDGPFSVLENPAVEGASPFWVVQIFPTTLLAITRGEFRTMAWYEMQIDAADRFGLRIHALMAPEQIEGAALYRKLLNEIHLEDIPMCEGVQRGLRSKLWQPAGLAVHEHALRRFHRHLAERLAGADA